MLTLFPTSQSMLPPRRVRPTFENAIQGCHTDSNRVQASSALPFPRARRPVFMRLSSSATATSPSISARVRAVQLALICNGC